MTEENYDWQPPETAPTDGTFFEITTAGPNQDLCWYDKEGRYGEPCFRDYFYKQRKSMQWPYVVAWRKVRPAAKVCNSEAESRAANGFPPKE